MMSNTTNVVRRAERIARTGKRLDALVLLLRHDVVVDDVSVYVGLNRTDARRTARAILKGHKSISFATYEDKKGEQYSVPRIA